ncbi:MAG TPA: hypothetical protein VKP58_09715 [Candidatus Acidoferrum sp.]|nr:hypothetical protein [Candidatus Acidoferrum sp.]
MRVLGAEEVTEWFKGFENLGVESDYVHADEDGLFFTHPEAACIDLEYPPKLEQLPFFAHCVATIGYQDQHFDGAFIWFDNWGVWNLFNEGIGYRIVEKLNIGAGQPRSFEASPGHQFRADELPDAIGMLLQPMIFAWDSYYLPIWSHGTGDFFLHISHDSIVNVITRTKAFHDRVFQQLEKLHLNPKSADDKRRSRFCHPRVAPD